MTGPRRSAIGKVRGTQAFALIRVSAEAYDEIAAQLKDAGYDRAVIQESGEGYGWLFMEGLALERGPASVESEAPKTFRLTANCTFNAASIEDAMQKLGDHFRNVGDKGVGPEGLVSTGQFEVRPVNPLQRRFDDEGPV